MKTNFRIFTDYDKQLFILSSALIAALILIFIIPKSIQTSLLIILTGTLLTIITILSLSKLLHTNGRPSESNISDSNNDTMTADKFLFEVLSSKNCNPEQDNDAIIFHYRGGNFKAVWLDNKVIRIIFPHIFAAPPSHHDQLIKIANQINIDYVLVKIVAVPRSDNSEILVHAIADFYYTSQNKNTSLLDEILVQFIDIQTDFIKEINSIKKEHQSPLSPLLTDFLLN